jgi:DNA-directed RNA polymerase specialized sigma24 family protein
MYVEKDPTDAVVEDLSFDEVLRTLDDDVDREILYLVCHEDLGPTEIAEILGLGRTAVSMRIHRMAGKLAAFRPAATAQPGVVSDDDPEDGSAERRTQ